MKFTSEDINNYCIKHGQKTSPICNEIKEDTFKNVYSPQMLSGEIENNLLGFLIKSIQAKCLVEIGTYTGYATLCMAENSGPDSIVHTFELDKSRIEKNKVFWKKSPVYSKIKPYTGPALENLELVEEPFDFVFIDADKRNYINYFKYCLKKLSKNGIIAIDNTLWSGKVLGPIAVDDYQTQTIHELNELVAQDETLYKCLLPVRDGILLVRKL